MARDTRAKRIVLVTFGSPGDLHPFLAIGAELRERGHQPIVATSAHYSGQVAAARLDFVPVRPDRSPGQQDPDFLDRVLRDRMTPAAVFRSMFLPSLRDSLEDLLGAMEGADAVVTHTLASAARLAAESRGLPWVSVVMQPMGYLSAYEPPLIGPRAISWVLRSLGPAATRPALNLARRLTDSWAMEWHNLRAELGLAPVRDHPLWEGQHSPDRSLGLFPRVLGEPQSDWPPQARVTGFPSIALRTIHSTPRCATFWRMGGHHSFSPWARPRSTILGRFSRRAGQSSGALVNERCFLSVMVEKRSVKMSQAT